MVTCKFTKLQPVLFSSNELNNNSFCKIKNICLCNKKSFLKLCLVVNNVRFFSSNYLNKPTVSWSF